MNLLRTPRWLATSVRNKLLAMALLPLLVAFPLLVLVLVLWGNTAYDRLLITKVRSDLAVARGYFDRVLVEIGSGTQGVAGSQALFTALQTWPSDPATLQDQLATSQDRLGLDFLVLYGPQGQRLAGALSNPDESLSMPEALIDLLAQTDSAGKGGTAQLVLLDFQSLLLLNQRRLNVYLMFERLVFQFHRNHRLQL